jgi:hypothetical protein
LTCTGLSEAWWNGRMPTSASDRRLLPRQAALQAEATLFLAELDLARKFADPAPPGTSAD